MRYIAIALLFLMPLSAAAEQRSNGARSRRAEALARRPDVVRPPAGERRPETRAEQQARRDWQRWPQRHRSWFKPGHGRYPFGSYYAVPYGGGGSYFFFAPSPAEAPPAEERRRNVTTGLVRIEVTPSPHLEYYVDGLFIGSSATLGTEFELNAGGRRIEIRSAGFHPLIRDLRIVAGEEFTIRGTLVPLAQPQPPPAAGNRTMFIIPGCYMGNARPTAAELRPGCDINKLITR